MISKGAAKRICIFSKTDIQDAGEPAWLRKANSVKCHWIHWSCTYLFIPVVLIGINDIGTGGMQFPGSTAPAPAMRTAADIIAGYQQLIARAHSQSPPVRIYGATLTPFEGTFAGYYTPEKENIRMAVNHWIRTSGKFDAVIDFDRAIQDPAHTARMAPGYDSGDKLHPNDAGYRKMSESIDLGLFE